jgi:hypothetical protein
MPRACASEAILRFHHTIIHSDPVWFVSSEDHLTTSLRDILASVLVRAARNFPTQYACKRHARDSAVAALLSHYLVLRAQLSALTEQDLFSQCLPAVHGQISTFSRYALICNYLEFLYGRDVGAAFRRPSKLLINTPNAQTVNRNENLNPELTACPADVDCMNWRELLLKDLIARCAKLSRQDLLTCIQCLPLSHRPVTTRLS